MHNKGNISVRTGCFTLIELLTVVAIIAILMAILLPALIRARGLGKRGACLNNFHQISMGCFIYADDFDRFPNLNKSWLGALGVAGPDWIQGWSKSEKEEAIVKDHFAQFCQDYLSQPWKFNASYDRMVVPPMLVCPGLSRTRRDVHYLPLYGAYGPCLDPSGMAAIGEPCYYNPSYGIGGGNIVGFASFLGMDDDRILGTDEGSIHTSHLRPGQFLDPSEETIILDTLFQRGGPQVRGYVEDTLWRIPHGGGNRPDGLNQVFADGSAHWIPFAKVNFAYQTGNVTDLQTITPFYCPMNARFHRGGYPSSKIGTKIPGWYGMGASVIKGNYFP